MLRTGLFLVVLLAVQTAAAAERVKVRVGEHPGFDRLVFDWARPIGVELEPAPDRARLRFDRPGELDLVLVRRDPPPRVRGVNAVPGPGGLNVVVDIAPGRKLRLMDSGSSTVLDILDPDTPLDAPAAKRAKSVKPARIDSNAGAGGRTAAAPPPVPIKPVTPAPTTAPGGSPTSLTGAVEAPAAPPAAAPAPPSGAPRAKPLSLLSPPASATAEPGKPGAQTPTSETPPRGGAASAAPAPRPRAKPAKSNAKTPGAASRPAQPPAPNPDSNPAETPAGEAGGPARLLIVADQGSAPPAAPVVHFLDGVPQTFGKLRFKWDAEAALAVFRRGSYLWLVFDRPAPGDVTEGLAELVPELAPIEQFPAPAATLIRMTAPPILEPVIARDGTTWDLEFWPRAPRPVPTLTIEPVGERRPEAVDYAMSMPGRVISFTDPGSGAAMIVVPSRAAGEGLALGQVLPQFRALGSFQGLALELSDDGLSVRVAEPGVRVTHPAGIVLSHGSSLAQLMTNRPRPALGPRLFDLVAWRRAEAGDFVPVRHALQAGLADPDPARQAAARLDLARFYFAHGLTHEAAGLLDVAESANPDLRAEPAIRLMRGAAVFLGGDYDGAARALFHPSLAGEAEAELWNAAMAATVFDWDVASQKFADHGHLIDAYPHRVRLHLWLTAAEAELAGGDLEAASAYLDKARDDDPSWAEDSQIAVLIGYIHLQKGETAEARALWQRVAQFSKHRLSQTRSRLALLDLAVAERSVTAAQAIEELERLRFAWRGDHIELAFMQRLGDLYLSQGRYRDSLRAFRAVTASLPNSRLARDVAERMRGLFFEMIAGDAAPDLAPLSALALYEEFKELTPPGARGDELLARLADRLVEVDLLPRAAELLTAQIEHRLSGADKAAMGARVASIHLLDDRPDKAIAVLGLSEEGGLPDDLKRRRTYLRARALAQLARYEDALVLIGADTHPEALRLRADLLWVQANWPAAAVVLGQLVPPKPRDDQVLTDAESRNVVDLAIALTLADEPERLAALNAAYKDAMAAGPDRETFALLSGGAAVEAERSIAEQLAAVDKVEDFMARYRGSRNQ